MIPLLAAVRFTRKECLTPHSIKMRGVITREDELKPQILWRTGCISETPVTMIERCTLDPEDRI